MMTALGHANPQSDQKLKLYPSVYAAIKPLTLEFFQLIWNKVERNVPMIDVNNYAFCEWRTGIHFKRGLFNEKEHGLILSVADNGTVSLASRKHGV